MPAIGHVTKSGDRFKGNLSTLSITADIEIVPNRDKANATQPDYRVFAGRVEVGAGWVRESERSGKEYVSLSFAAPEFGQRKLYANLGQAAGQDDPEVFAIIWNPED